MIMLRGYVTPIVNADDGAWLALAVLITPT